MISILVLSFIAIELNSKNFRKGTNKLIFRSLVWEGNSYAAFTSLITHNGYFFCAFREANMHVDLLGGDTGHIVVLRSKNGKSWEPFRIINIDGFDLRDPQLFTNSDKQLILLVEKVKYENNKARIRESCYMNLMDNSNQICISPIIFENDIRWNWLWNVNVLKDTIFGFTYAPYFALYKSVDGKQYKHVSTPKLGHQPTESAIIDLNKNIILAVVRQTNITSIGKSHDNGKTWKWKQSAHRVECPKMIHFKKKIILVGRNTDKDTHTSLYLYNEEKEDFDVIFDLPDYGDCSYPGIVEKNGFLYISYYQSIDTTHSNICIAKVKIKE